MPLFAGVSEIDITPPVGAWMCGYAFRPTGCVGIHDPLKARALVVSDNSTTIAFLTMDLLGLDFDLVDRIRTGIARRSGIHANAVMLHATHTHGGPNVGRLNCMGSRDPEYIEFLVDQLIAAAQLAATNLKDVSFAFGRAPAQIGVNRRQIVNGKSVIGENPEGPTAPYVDVLTVHDTGGTPLALLFSHACHPTTLGGDNLEITSDYCGYACDYVSNALGGAAIPFFLQGCAGNINPSPRGTFEIARRHGECVAEAALVAMSNSERLTDCSLDFSVSRTELPLIPPPDRAICADQVARWENELRSELKAGNMGRILNAEGLIAFHRQELNMSMSGAPTLTKRFELQVFDISGIRILGMPAEMFVQYGLEFESLAGPPVVALAYTNGVHGYVPTAADYPFGGYEVDGAYKYYGSLMFAPQCEPIIREAAYRLLKTDDPDLTPFSISCS